MEDVTHTVQVSAGTLYEAIALGLRAIKKDTWTGDIPEGLNRITVQIMEDPIEHSVDVQTFKNWLRRDGNSPSDRIARAKIREILR